MQGTLGTAGWGQGGHQRSHGLYAPKPLGDKAQEGEKANTKDTARALSHIVSDMPWGNCSEPGRSNLTFDSKWEALGSWLATLPTGTKYFPSQVSALALPVL